MASKEKTENEMVQCFRKSLRELKSTRNFEDILNVLVSDDVIDAQYTQYFLNLERDLAQKREVFLFHFLKRGDVAMEKLDVALKATNNDRLADSLRKEMEEWASQPTRSHNNLVRSDSTEDCVDVAKSCSPSFEVQSTMPTGSPVRLISSSVRPISTPVFDDDCPSSKLFDEFNQYWQYLSTQTCPLVTPDNIKVKTAKVYNQKAYRAYQMMSKPRGFACIVSNINFKGDPASRRNGGHMDTLCFENLFEALGFEVQVREDVTKDDLMNIESGIITRFLDQFKLAEVDACIFVIMSHGHADYIRTVDHEVRGDPTANNVHIEEIIWRFNNRNCKELIGKPKLFFVQACRGRESDRGIGCVLETDLKSFSWKKRADSFNQTSRIPTYEDILVCYSTVPGFISNRDTKRGTWYVECLTKVFMLSAHDTEIMEMLKRVNMMLRMIESEDGAKQSCSFSNHAFNYDFYFNPGLFASWRSE